MNAPSISNPKREQPRQWQMSLWYAMLLTGVFGGAYIPLAYWGPDGLLLCIWVAVIGLALLHEQLFAAACLIVVGILCTVGADMPLSAIQRGTISSPGVAVNARDFVIPLATIFGLGICFAALAVWMVHSMPQDVAWMIQVLGFNSTASGLQANQFSIFHLMGLMTLACLSAVPIFYGGTSSGMTLSPIILSVGVLIIYGNHRLAFLVLLGIPILMSMYR